MALTRMAGGWRSADGADSDGRGMADCPGRVMAVRRVMSSAVSDPSDLSDWSDKSSRQPRLSWHGFAIFGQFGPYGPYGRLRRNLTYDARGLENHFPESSCLSRYRAITVFSVPIRNNPFKFA